MFRCLLLAPPLACVACVADVEMAPPSNDAGNPGTNTPGGGGTTYFYRFAGTVPTSNVIPFGGTPYCDYAVELTQIVVDVVVRDSGHFIGGLVTDLMTEQALNGCPHGVSPPNPQVYEYAGDPVVGDTSFAVALVPGAGNYPDATLDLAISAPSNDQLPAADVRWKRIDQPPPLDWEVAIRSLELQPIPCTTGSITCLGRDRGALYSCHDGLRMRESKICVDGCANETSCR